ncbi:MAG: hypothetical protein D6807_03690 [Alphaproteobacteria bacterium]|nr:MAG: hypothetical protein D6807_03690 [Alphaproteobacteria bacterium]
MIRTLPGPLAALSVAVVLLVGATGITPACAHPPGEDGSSTTAELAKAGAHAAAAMPEHVSDHAGDEEEAHAHNHAAHEHGSWAKTGFERFLAWLGAFHPAATNFPIALLLFAVLAELLYAIRGKESDRTAAHYCLWGGALAAAGTAVLGWFYAGFDLAADDPLLAAHRWNGTFVAVLALLALWLGVRNKRGTAGDGAYRLGLVIVTLLASFNGYLGGRMLYGADHYEWPRAEAHEHDHDAAMPEHHHETAGHDEERTPGNGG